MLIVETKDIYKDYKVNKLIVKALRGVSVNIEEGEFTAIVGPSGSGKSTLLHLIGCLDTLTKGKIKVEGNDISALTERQLAQLRRQKIGFIFQAYNLIPVLSALENVSFPLTLLGWERKEADQAAYQALSDVGLAGMEKRKPNELSGGQQQRIAIARSLVKKPKLILADEPTANLDSETGRSIMEIMLKLNSEKKASFIFSTHDPMVIEYARRRIILNDGRIKEDTVK